LLPLVWPLPRSLATTSGISVDFSSSPYLDVSVQAVPHVYLFIQYTLTRYCRAGFPHSEISGSKLMCSSPKLFAAYRVLHRLLMPRHSPCALISLTFSFWFSSELLKELCRHSKKFSLANCNFFTHCTRKGTLFHNCFVASSVASACLHHIQCSVFKVHLAS
jgi:hypothetical protein